MVASRNSMCGMIMLFSLFVICAVPRNSPRPGAPATGPTAPYLRTGCCLAPARRCVVRIERQHLIVSFHREIVLSRLVKAVGFSEQLLHFFNLVDEVWRDRFVEVTGRAQMLVEFLGFAAIGIVTAA